MQTVAEITFRASDFEYIGARSADEALKLAKEKKPAIILADAVMPGKTGYDLCQAAKSDPELASIPVVLLCGNSQAYDAAKGAEVGADAHMTK
ncbi:MAG: response regulator, partial [Deltaproteobacteria bacterium]|nr:response regulator [Deltaproteobacteria bacterium]